EHFRDPAFVDVANHSARPFPLDENFGDLVVLEYRDPCFVGARGDDHLLAHARNSESARSVTYPRGGHPALRRQSKELPELQRDDAGKNQRGMAKRAGYMSPVHGLQSPVL